MTPPYPVVWITWVDSAIRGGQHDVRDLDDFEPLIMESVGWLIRENEKAVWLCLEAIPSVDAIRDAVTIPIEAIRNRVVMAPAHA